ncbi:MAG: D-arabinono-1,4-lactone oxidase [Pseudomonadota bacterium]
MTASPQLKRVASTQWENFHQSQSATVQRHYQLLPAAGKMTANSLRQSAELVLDLIDEARQSGATIRPLASNWSFSKISAQENCWMLDTTWSRRKNRLRPRNLDPGFAGDPDGLMLLQCGQTISYLNHTIEREFGRSLATTGASNGQTYVGAMSAGTHGSAIGEGAMQSRVVAIQLLSVDRQNLWLERPGKKVLKPELVAEFGSTLKRDDDLFDAALCSLGLLGVIHAVVVETVPIFLLSSSQFEHAYDSKLRNAMRSLDPASLDIPGDVDVPAGNPQPYFFQFVLNPHAPDDPTRVKLMYKLPWDPTHTIDYREQGKWGPTYDLAEFVGKLLESASAFTPLIATQIFKLQLSLFRNKVGTWGQTFNYTTPRRATAGAAIAVPASRSDEALDIFIKTHKDHGPAPLAFACRFVQKTPGYLSFTRFDPTCVIDIDGLAHGGTLPMMERIRTALDDAGIPYAQHWGKHHDLRHGRLERSYGADLAAFRAARDRLLPSAADKTVFELGSPETAVGS